MAFPGSHFRAVAPGGGGGALPPAPQLVLSQVASDNFARANSALAGSHNWLATSEGTMTIVNNEASGNAGVGLGNYRTSETYNSNQYAQCTVGGVPLVSNGYIGLSVRNQDNANNYTAIYFNNTSASQYQLIIYKKVAGTFTALVTGVLGGALAPGTLLQFVAEGSQLTFSTPNLPLTGGVTLVDSTFTGGVPGIESFGLNSLDSWVGGNAATTPLSTATASDNFNRANGGVSAGQANWQVMTYSPAVGTTVDATIVSNQIVDTTATVHSGDVRTDTFTSDQWSQIQEGTTAMNATGFTGATVRNQAGGQSCYLGVFFHNNEYAIYRLDANGGGAGAGTSTAIAVLATPGNDPAGTTYAIMAKGSRISLRVNGAEVIAATDAAYSGGTPGLMFFATASGDNWSAGNT